MQAHQHPRPEQGQITVLIVVFALCLLLTTAAVTDISASYLRRRALASLADGAALSAANDAAQAAIYGDPDTTHVLFEQAVARSAVDQYLRRVGAYADHPSLTAQVTVEDATLTVQLAMTYRLPFPIPGASPDTTIEVAGTAEMPIY